MIIGGEQAFCRELSVALNDENTEIHFASSIYDAKHSFDRTMYSLMIIDYPELMVFRADEETILWKPVSMNTCVEKAHLILQQGNSSYIRLRKNTSLTFGKDLIIDTQYHFVESNGQWLELARKEFELLYFLAKHAGQVLSPAQIYKQIWEEDPTSGVDATIKVHISTLRKKLALAGKENYIQNVWGVGYKFMPPPV